jgi:hypothetical protein
MSGMNFSAEERLTGSLLFHRESRHYHTHDLVRSKEETGIEFNESFD